MIGFVDAVKLFFKRYVDFEGRSSRAEYWWVTLFIVLVYIAFMILVGVLGAAGSNGAAGVIAGLLGLMFLAFFLGIIIPSIAVAVRRLHDTDKSGWWYLICLIPFGSIVLLVFFCLDGTPGTNRFGPDPYGRADVDTFN